MNNLYIGLLRLENRAAFFVQAKASQVTPRETAEERFHTLARGWLAYPVTPTHTHLPPKSGCRGIHRDTFRRGATTPSRNPVRGAKRQRAGTQRISLSTACRRYATSPETTHFAMRKTAEERFHTLARGWFAYPVTPRTHIYRRRAVVDVDS